MILNILLTATAIVSAVTAVIALLIARTSANSAKKSVEIISKKLTLDTEIARIGLKIQPGFTVLPNARDSKKYYDANIIFVLENVYDEEGIFLQYDLAIIRIGGKICNSSSGRSRFPLPKGQTFKCSYVIPDIPQNVPLKQYDPCALILLIKYKGRYLPEAQIQKRRYEYMFNGRELFLLPDDQYDRIESNLPGAFKRSPEDNLDTQQ